jgi:serine/threonine-protein kinase
VPVYDLGQADEGVPFFTMRRVEGRTLEQVLEARSAGDVETTERFSEQRLLAAFAQLCLALDFVHERGVVHRDLKPSNVMFGKYGEVYLLDWGLAKVLGADEERSPEADEPHARLKDSAPQTHYGTILGTPGFVAPELVGDDPVVSQRADIYSLGALLFEIVTGEPLHRGETVVALVHSTRSDVTERVREVADLPPELEELVLWATRLDPDERCSSARDLQEGVQRYLDGHRDSERRRQQAAALVAEVEAAREAASEDSVALRSAALAKLGRALALDPDHDAALQLLLALLTDPPVTLPDEVRAELRAQEAHQTRKAGRLGAAVFLGLNLFIPVAILTGIRAWWVVILFSALTTATGLTSYVVSKLPRPSTRSALLVYVFALATATSTAALLGPFLLAPLIILVVTLLFTLNHPPEYRRPFVALGLVAAFLPVLLEWTGLVPPSMIFDPAGITVVARASELRQVPTLVLLTIASAASIVIAGGAIGPIRREVDDMHARIRLQAWQLKQMVPTKPNPRGEEPPASDGEDAESTAPPKT